MRRGWRGLGIKLSIAANKIAFSSMREGCCADITSEAPGIKASSPRPRPNFCLATSYNLLCQRTVSHCSRRKGVIVKNRLTETGRFTEAHAAVDDRMKCLPRE